MSRNEESELRTDLRRLEDKVDEVRKDLHLLIGNRQGYGTIARAVPPVMSALVAAITTILTLHHKGIL